MVESEEKHKNNICFTWNNSISPARFTWNKNTLKPY